MNEKQYQDLVDGVKAYQVALDTDLPNSALKRCIFPGSFNPLHAGHIEMVRQSFKLLSTRVWHEISIHNVEKSPLSWADLQNRMEQSFAHEGCAGLLVSKCPTFESKAHIFPGATFIVGADTINRISELRFYENQRHQESVFELFKDHQCDFLVFGRKIENRFRSSDLQLHPKLKTRCRFVDRSNFEIEISSSQLRDQTNR